MTDPLVRSVGTRANNVNVLAPSPVVAGDQIVIAITALHSSSTAATFSLSGFAPVPAYSTSTNGELATFFMWKVADSTDVALSTSAGSYTLIPGTNAGVVSQVAIAIQDADPTSPVRDVVGAISGSSNIAAPPTSLSGLTAGDLLIWFVGLGTNFTMPGIPSGSTRLLPSAAGRIHANSLSLTSSGGSGTFNATLSTTANYGVGLIAIRGVTGPPPVNTAAFLEFI